MRHVVIADWLFTATTVVFQPASGLYMMYIAGIPFDSRWIVWTFVLYFVAGACWLPVVWIQLRIRAMADAAVASGSELPARFDTYFRWWVALGIPAFLALVVVFWLMVAKPA